MKAEVAGARMSVGARRSMGEDLRAVVHNHAPLSLLMIGYILGGLWLLGLLPRHIVVPIADSYRLPLVVAGLYLAVTLLATIVRVVFVGRAAPLGAETWATIVERWLPRRRLFATLLVLALLPAFQGVMLGFRTAITDFEPFRWDPAFMRLDRWLHGGRAPWELLQPLLGHPVVTRLVDGFYVYGWFFIVWIGVTWQTVHGREPVRSQFLLTFVLAWIVLGTAGAILFSSAGPAYYGRVTGLQDPYAPLMGYLAAVDTHAPLRALAVQARLWSEYQEWGGITAMPSMHVAQAVIVLLAAVRTYRRLVWAAVPALLLIMIGSVHLGWHYAVDAYAGAAGALALWWLVGKFVVWWRAADRAADAPPEPLA